MVVGVGGNSDGVRYGVDSGDDATAAGAEGGRDMCGGEVALVWPSADVVGDASRLCGGECEDVGLGIDIPSERAETETDTGGRLAVLSRSLTHAGIWCAESEGDGGGGTEDQVTLRSRLSGQRSVGSPRIPTYR